MSSAARNWWWKMWACERVTFLWPWTFPPSPHNGHLWFSRVVKKKSVFLLVFWYTNSKECASWWDKMRWCITGRAPRPVSNHETTARHKLLVSPWEVTPQMTEWINMNKNDAGHLFMGKQPHPSQHLPYRLMSSFWCTLLIPLDFPYQWLAPFACVIRLLGCPFACVAISSAMCSTAKTPIMRTRWPFILLPDETESTASTSLGYECLWTPVSLDLESRMLKPNFAPTYVTTSERASSNLRKRYELKI